MTPQTLDAIRTALDTAIERRPPQPGDSEQLITAALSTVNWVRRRARQRLGSVTLPAATSRNESLSLLDRQLAQAKPTRSSQRLS